MNNHVLESIPSVVNTLAFGRFGKRIVLRSSRSSGQEVEEYECLGSSSADTRHDSIDVLGEIRTLRKWKETRIMIDSGATSFGYIDMNYAKTRHLNLKKLDRP